ncbi:MAG: ROK family protein [Cellulomonadaceae bacterium]
MNDLVIALDIGGTNARAEIVDRAGHVVAAAWAPTPTGDGAATVAVIGDLCCGLLDRVEAEARPRVRAVGVGVPGVVVDGVVRTAANLGWRNAPVARELTQRLGLPVFVYHDVTVAGLAERVRGAGTDVADLLAVFVGTGIAASIVVGGRPVTGGLHQPGEIGHVPVHPGGRRCLCGQRGCLEAYASARSIGADYARATGLAGATSIDVVAALGTDQVADAVWAQAVDALALGLLGAISLLSPSLVIVGGGLAQAGDVLFDPLRARLHERARVVSVPEVVPAALGLRAGIIGAGLATFDALDAGVAARDSAP